MNHWEAKGHSISYTSSEHWHRSKISMHILPLWCENWNFLYQIAYSVTFWSSTTDSHKNGFASTRTVSLWLCVSAGALIYFDDEEKINEVKNWSVTWQWGLWRVYFEFSLEFALRVFWTFPSIIINCQRLIIPFQVAWDILPSFQISSCP